MVVSLFLQIPSSRGQCTSQSKWTGLSQGTDSWEMRKPGLPGGARGLEGREELWVWSSVVPPVRVGSYWQGSWREGALLESGGVNKPFPRSSAPQDRLSLRPS